MKFSLFGRKASTDISPAPNIVLRQPVGGSFERIYGNDGLWRKAACFATINATVRSYPALFEDLPLVSFQWSEKIPREGELRIFCEHGWLPRDTYQISASGCNQQHPVTRILRSEEVKFEPTADELLEISKMKRRFREPSVPQDLCDRPFFLFALQLTKDLNLQRCGLELARFAGQENGNEQLLKALSEMFSSLNPEARILFLQHPMEEISPRSTAFLPANHVYVPKERKIRSLDLAMSENCKGVVSINSNALNEALLFSKPVFQVGDFLMKGFPNPFFPYSLKEFLEQPEHCGTLAHPLSYLVTLMRNQFTLQDLSDPFVLRDLIAKEFKEKNTTR